MKSDLQSLIKSAEQILNAIREVEYAEVQIPYPVAKQLAAAYQQLERAVEEAREK